MNTNNLVNEPGVVDIARQVFYAKHHEITHAKVFFNIGIGSDMVIITW